MAGMTIVKGYELRERIGSGGFGAVYRAFQSTVGREVAIKIILPRFANHPDFIRRFEHEAQLIARLEHLHIVPLYDYWRDPDGAYLVMRWLRGGSLKDALRKGPFEPEVASMLLDQITAALSTAHRSGIIHRDLKPANVLLDEDGNAYLADFGIAKDLGNRHGDQTDTDIILGSPDYLAPEQARREHVSPQTDIYSLGVVLYEMLTGQHPFPGATSVECMYKHLNEPLPTIDTLPDDITDNVNAVIQKATAKNPAHRYSDALELMTTFREATAMGRTVSGESLVEQLTLREQEVLQLVIDGCTNLEIAQQLCITLATVKWHVRQVYRKLRVRNRVQAIVRARELHLITPDTHPESQTAEATYVTLPEPNNPYKGLRAFQTVDALDFFGRERFVHRLIDRLQESGRFVRFLAVIGPSGSGKSSIVKAGLIPALWRGEIPGSDRWFVAELTPGTRPLDELEVALTRIAADQAGNLHDHLNRDKHGLLRLANLILPQDGSELAIIVDQFEEVFTLVEDETARMHFLDLLYAAVVDPRSRVRVVITLRADFYDRPLHFPAFGELVRNRMETVLPLAAEELEAAIIKPANRIGVTFEPGLVASIMGEINYQPGALPLLQYALTELFERREGRVLTQAAYRAAGGAIGALAQRADALYHEQDTTGRDTIRQLFLRLVTLGEGTENARRRVSYGELMALTAEQDLMDEIIDTFAAYRLLSLDHDPATRSPTVEIAHEAILSEWDRLRGWLDSSRQDIRQQRLLAAASVEWLQAEKDASYLLHGNRLEQFLEWVAQTDLALTQDERDYLDSSQARQTSEDDLERERHTRELTLAQHAAEAARQAEQSQHRAANRLRYLVAALGIFLLVAAGLSLFAFDRQRRERDARAKAEREAAVNRSLVLAQNAQWVLLGEDPDLALLLALEAVDMDDPPYEARQALKSAALGPGTRAILQEQGNEIRTVAFSPDGQWALSGSCRTLDASGTCVEGDLSLWDLQTYKRIRQLEGHHGWINDVMFMPDSHQALSASSDGTLIVWDVTTGEIVRQLEEHSAGVNAVALVPANDPGLPLTAISAADDAQLILWDLDNNTIIRRFEGLGSAAISVDVSSDGSYVVAGLKNGAIVVWDIATGDLIQEIAAHAQRVTSVIFLGNTDGEETTLLSSSADFSVKSWTLGHGQAGGMCEYDTGVNDAVVMADGRSAWLANDAYIAGCNLEQWNLSAIYTSPYPIMSIAVSPDNNMILTGTSNGILRLWNLGHQPEIYRLEIDVTGKSVIDTDKKQMVTLTAHGPVLWNIDESSPAFGTVIRRFEPENMDNIGLALHPDGTQLLVGYADFIGGTGNSALVVYDINTGERLHRLQEHVYYVRSMAFSPDGQLALSGSMQWKMGPGAESGAGELIWWDATTWEPIRRVETAGDITSIAFSQDGKRAVTSSVVPESPNYVSLWDVQTGALIRQYEYSSGADTLGGYWVTFGPDETSLLASSMYGHIDMWDITTGELLRRLDGHKTGIYQITLSHDGHYLASSGFDSNVVVWDIAAGEEIQRFSGHTSDAFGVVFSPDDRSIFSSSRDGTVRQWRIAEWSLDELTVWAHNNRYLRDFTCKERTRYRIEPQCE